MRCVCLWHQQNLVHESEVRKEGRRATGGGWFPFTGRENAGQEAGLEEETKLGSGQVNVLLTNYRWMDVSPAILEGGQCGGFESRAVYAVLRHRCPGENV